MQKRDWPRPFVVGLLFFTLGWGPSPSFALRETNSAESSQRVGLEEKMLGNLEQRLKQQLPSWDALVAGELPPAMEFRERPFSFRREDLSFDPARIIGRTLERAIKQNPKNKEVADQISAQLQSVVLIELSFESLDPDPLPVKEAREVTAILYRPSQTSSTEKCPLVLIPGYGSADPFPPLVALYLLKQGVASLVLYLPFYSPRSPQDWMGKDSNKIWEALFSMEMEENPSPSPGERAGRFAEQSLIDLMTMTAWAGRQPWVDPNRISLVGHSLPGGLAHLLFHLNPQFFSLCSVSPVGDIGHLFLETERYRPLRGYLERTIPNLNEFREEIRFADPRWFTPSAHPASRRRLLMVSVPEDEIVSSEYFQALMKKEKERGGDLSWLKAPAAPAPSESTASAQKNRIPDKNHLLGWLPLLGELLPRLSSQVKGQEKEFTGLEELGLPQEMNLHGVTRDDMRPLPAERSS